MIQQILNMNDRDVECALKLQVLDSNTRYYGGVTDPVVGIPRPGHMGTACAIGAMIASYVNPQSRYYHDTELRNRLLLAADYMLNRQHADGTISPGGTNFHSPPDTGFVINGLCQAFRVLRDHSYEEVKPLAEKIRLFLERTIPAMLTGGCHTPNHRWVMTAALGSLYDIFQLDPLVQRANEWLAEGMDITEDGEWTERSNGIYNTVSDIMLYYTARFLNCPDLLEHVRRNLQMMVYLIHPNGNAVTEYSGRQDYGKKHDLSEYYLIYHLMAVHDQDPLFASMADLTAATLTQLGPVNNHAMLGATAFPEIQILDIPRAPIPDKYVKVFNRNHPVAEHLDQMEQVGHHSHILHSSMHTSFGAPFVRHRNGKTSVTSMTRAPAFFSLLHGKAHLIGIQLFTVFTPGRVEMEYFALEEDRCCMRTRMSKGYNAPIAAEDLPITARENSSPWYLLPHHLRKLTHVQEHEISVEVTPVREDEWHIRIQSDQREDVITQVIFQFASDNVLEGSQLGISGDHTQYWKGGKLRCTAGDDAIEISSGAFDHLRTAMYSSEEQTQDVLINLLTPFDKVFSIRLL